MGNRKQGQAKITSIPLHRAVKGHLLWCHSVSYSKHTIADYSNTHRLFLEFMGDDILLPDITQEDIERFLSHMRDTPINACKGVTSGHGKKLRKRSKKTLLNYHISLGSLWTWAVTHGFASDHVVQSVKPPNAKRKPINPLTEDEIVRLIRASNNSRDRAIVALLLDTAIRATELCNLVVGDVRFEQAGGSIYIRSGKGDVDRIVPFNARCANYLQLYLLTRDVHDSSPLFTNISRNKGQHITRDVLGRQLQRLARRANVKQANPHRLRTTAACLMAANGLSALQLQRIMGHTDVKTTQRYVEAANMDLGEAMRTASPLENLRL